MTDLSYLNASPGWYVQTEDIELSPAGRALRRGVGALGGGIIGGGAGASLAELLDQNQLAGLGIGAGLGALLGGVAAAPPDLELTMRMSDTDALRELVREVPGTETTLDSIDEYLKGDQPGYHAYFGPKSSRGDHLSYQVRHIPGTVKNANAEDAFWQGYTRVFGAAGLVKEAKDADKSEKKPLNKPIREEKGGKKFKVYVKDPSTGNIKTVRFGDANMTIKKDDPARKKSFRARHKCDQKTDKTTAGYWSCKMWE